MRRLQSGAAVRSYDSSGMGPGICGDGEIEREVDLECIIDSMDNNNVEINHQYINHVKDLSATAMREKLIIHFDILFRRQQVHWPRRSSN